MPVADIGDPRLQALFGANDDADVRPAVRLPGKGVPPVVAGVGIVLAGVALFAVLNARRAAQSIESSPAPAEQISMWDEPPPLTIPQVAQPVLVPITPEARPARVIVRPPAAIARVMPPQTVIVPQPAPVTQLAPPPFVPPPPPRTSAGSALVIDGGSAPTGSTPAVASDANAFSPSGPIARTRASALANRSMTVPQGNLIPAVLETGFDSTRAGYARAVVSRDVRGFDNKNVLIPRGSRLIGNYKSAVARGQKRAIITWTRLIRPDGMTIAMDAPSVDTVGRSGVAASVNTHFFSRLGDAVLQTTLSLGGAFAGRSVTGPVVVLPNGGGSTIAPQLPTSSSYEPTLSVRPGTSISVFVAQDLDFSTVSYPR